MNVLEGSKEGDAIGPVIEAAETIRDPLEGLAEKTAVDPAAPFHPIVLEGLVRLKRKDRIAFEALRLQLKNAGCRVVALDKRQFPRMRAEPAK